MADDALFAVLTAGRDETVLIPTRDALPGPCPWVPLHRALGWLDEAGVVRDEDAAFVAVVVGVPAEEWTPHVAVHARGLATGPYRAALEDAGWDVDLLPVFEPVGPSDGFEPVGAPSVPASWVRGTGPGPATDTKSERVESVAERPGEPVRASAAAPAGSNPEPPSSTALSTGSSAPPNVPSGVVLVVAGRDDTVAVLTAADHPVRDAARGLPGARWNGVNGWEFPVTRETALALRGLLTGHKTAIDREVAARLKTAADTPVGPAVTLAGDGDTQRIEIRFAHTPDRQADVKRLARASWDGPAGCWHAPVTNVDGVLRFADLHSLVVDPAVEAVSAARFEPFDYDGTIDGLRGVPISELHFVRAVPARNVGTKREVASLETRLNEYGIVSLYDLLMTIPFRYQDRSTQVPIRDLRVGEEVGFLARVTDVGRYDRQKRMLKITVADGTGSMTVTFFNAPWMMHRFRVKDEVVVFGRVDVWQPRNGRAVKQMTNPLMDPVGDDKAMIVPVYPQSEKSKVTTWDIHGAAMEAVRRLGDLQDPIPDDIKTNHGLMDRAAAYKQVHNPDTVELAEQARTRLAFDELFRMQMALGLRRYATAAETGVVHAPTGELTGPFLTGLRFEPTGAQQRALAEIREDLLRPHPMFRLLQGDVGAGKTLIALVSLLSAVEGGYQGALMAPTEILATQLHAELRDECAKIVHPDGRPLVVDFLGGKTRVKEKRRILAGLADGSVDIVVGTHALLTDEVEFANLGLVVIDEQHRFGVEQRAALRAKGKNGSPDMLVMTATPIPRTAALTVYGDLAVTVLDELPPGRTPIVTTWLEGEPPLDGMVGPPWDRVRTDVEAGRQAYVVASLVEDNEKIAAASAEAALEALEAGALSGLRLGLVHGRQPRDEREATMQAFKRHELDVLVATTVIEVGVNVPNATGMVVLDATRFGIAQLHQIRGRVGRGAHASWCVLTGKAGSGDAVQRMNALVASTDGFYLSEVDLNLRGEGSIFGARQSGQTDLRVASLKNDRDLVVTCRAEADRILDGDPRLARRPGLRNEVLAALGDEAQEWLAKS